MSEGMPSISEGVSSFLDSAGYGDSSGTTSEQPAEESSTVEASEEQTSEPVSETAQEEKVNEEKTEEATESDESVPEAEKAKNYQAAMREERAKRQEERARRENIERELENNRHKMAQYEQALQRVISAQQQRQQPQQPQSNYDDDPLGYLKNSVESMQNNMVQQQQYLQNQYQSAQQQQQVQHLADNYRAKANEFAKDNPDFTDAYNHLVQSRMNQYLAAGLNQQQAQQQLVEEELAIAAKAFTDGVNPAERLYNVSKSLGYQKQAQAAAPAKNIETIQKGIQASKSLGNASGKTKSQSSSLEKLVEMSDGMDGREFDELWAKIEAENYGSIRI